MAVGSIWPSPSSAFYPASVSTAASPTSKLSATKSKLGRTTAMPITPRPTGTSQPRTPASNSNTYTLQSKGIGRLVRAQENSDLVHEQGRNLRKTVFITSRHRLGLQRGERSIQF